MPVETPVRVLLDEADAQQALTIFNTLGLEVQSAITVLAARNYLEEPPLRLKESPHAQLSLGRL